MLLNVETPPRAWGRRDRRITAPYTYGNTPTSVGKTCQGCASRAARGKHPHERGEDCPCRTAPLPKPETPPRAWGRLGELQAPFLRDGNTPTSVGKTSRAPQKTAGNGKHPHERGEDGTEGTVRRGKGETPPRAWGRLSVMESMKPLRRNTPTSVGKTRHWPGEGHHPVKHPHERGEDSRRRGSSMGRKETPPRAWGRLAGAIGSVAGGRNTPTSVGKTIR